MPGQFLRLDQCSTVPDEPSDMGVAAHGVEVGDPLRRLIRNPDPLQVLLHHETGLLAVEAREERGIRLHPLRPFAHERDQLRMHGQRILPPVL
jgi:hypothetical protein